ncbi:MULTISPECIES: cytosine permease [unclassified Streptomyces]|uniref:Cytosine permease n=1 Tax=Streptomyces sp. NBC_00119 TaxID=2975659 RepID=A0AAU1UA44_9ACTN|nr:MULTISPECIES: cytosine permease [unclassified Streptomyces]MCX4644650.1 cytosine permease [Streptomyces sp. NBC_01446]MCX5326695.1 cytosine permease [Streptomyces sp. NBC_00120]
MRGWRDSPTNPHARTPPARPLVFRTGSPHARHTRGGPGRFYLVHRGRYALGDLFAPDGGRYGRFNPVALTSYAIGIAVQLPFVATSLYTGPLVAPLGGADLSWLVGLSVTAPVYYVWARRVAMRGGTAVAEAETGAPAESASATA